MKSLFIILYLIFISAVVRAGDIKGNGGGAILCQGQSLEILDFYEATSLGYGKPDFAGAVSETEIESVYLARIAVHSTQRSEIYKQWLNSFASESVFIENIPIEEISDLGVTLPDNCSWHQIVNQNSILLSGGKKYLIDQTLWGRLSPSQKVGLMMHELFYRESSSKTSKGLRLLNALLATNQFNQLDLPSRSLLFKDAGLAWMEAQGIAFLLNDKVVIQDQKLKMATAVKGMIYHWKNQNLILREDPVTFFPSGSVSSLRISNDLTVPVGSSVLSFSSYEYSTDALKFYENGNFQEGSNNFSGSSLKNNSGYFSFSYAYFSEAAELLKISGALGYVTIKSKNFEVGRESEVFFHARGVVKSFIWASNEPIEIGSLFFYPKIFTSVTLAPTGVVSQLITDKDVQFTNNQGQKVKYFAGDTIHFL